MKTVILNNLLIAKYLHNFYHFKCWIIKNRLEPWNQVLYDYREVEIFLLLLVYNLNLKWKKKKQKEEEEEEKGKGNILIDFKNSFEDFLFV